ncbi:MAG: Protein of unknown function DUF1592/DUF1588/DUF1587/DUF1585/DUF1595/Planctomycete cytochrome C [Verrucomicrobia bacterium]|nr:MAG: Protein of unknown function DUF1592/DUF1588/DUF1587/DUF1585/DUF1595/Planctomycete cytochrome C [Verrucomicrobiota bacterium]
MDGSSAPVLETSHRAFLTENCQGCHNAKTQKGRVRLDDIPFTVDTVERADLWQKILNSLNSGEMPPEDEKQPDPGAKAEFLDALSRTLVTARSVLSDSGGRITMRRLNRREYKNTLRDLLGVDLNVGELPADGGAGNFDTVGASLFMSSNQFEQYQALGRQALEEHFARYVAPDGAAPRFVHFEAEERNERIRKGLADRMAARERYVRWTGAVDRAAQVPGNAAITGPIRAASNGSETKFYASWERIPGAPSPAEFGFTDAVHADQEGRRDWEHYVPHHKAYVAHAAIKTGAFLTVEDVYVNPYQPFRIPGDWPAGDYVVRVRLGATAGSPAARRFVEFGSQHDSGVRAVTSSHQVTGTLENPQVLEIPLKFSPAKGRGWFFQEKGTSSEGGAAHRIFGEAKQRNGIGPEFALWIDWIEVRGAERAGQDGKGIRERREVELHANAMVGGTYNGYFKGGYEEAKKFLESGQPQKGIPDELEAKFRIRAFEQNGPTYERYLSDPLTKTGAYLTIYNVHKEEVITLPPDQPSGWLKTKHEVELAEPGDYRLRFRIGAVPGTSEDRHFVDLGSRKAGDEDFTLMQTFQISGTMEAPEVIEVPVSLTADGPRTFVLREKRDVKLDHDRFMTAQKATGQGPPPALWIDWVEWEGPLRRSGSGSGVPPVIATGETKVSTVLESFAKRAFRGKQPSAAFLDKLTALYEVRRKAGDTHETALKEPLSVILASPGFLYLQEIGGGEGRGRLSPEEFASRLSYFLWSAPPDQALLTADLTRSEELVRQVARLLSSEKSDEFVSGFVHQWLGMERLDFFQFDTKQFSDFDESARSAARREVYETFAHLLRHNGSLTKLLKSDEIHVNGLLANYYGIDGVRGDDFRRVALPKGSPRGGLLGMAAILAMGSNGERTSPVERGAWVLRKLLHNPPPPAPPNVPQLDRLAGKPVSPRERLLAHQEEPQCLQCHRKIDPIGFGLENFNAAGKWRNVDHDPKTKRDWPIDPSGAFHHGPAFASFFELRDLIAAQPEPFARGFAEALIEYSLGRPYGFTDAVLADEILAKAKAKDFALSEFVVALVQSESFGRK